MLQPGAVLRGARCVGGIVATDSPAGGRRFLQRVDPTGGCICASSERPVATGRGIVPSRPGEPQEVSGATWPVGCGGSAGGHSRLAEPVGTWIREQSVGRNPAPPAWIAAGGSFRTEAVEALIDRAGQGEIQKGRGSGTRPYLRDFRPGDQIGGYLNIVGDSIDPE